jgi:hypothetical protein
MQRALAEAEDGWRDDVGAEGYAVFRAVREHVATHESIGRPARP